MADDLDGVIAQATGSAPPSTAPTTPALSASGPDLPPQTGTAAPMPPAAEQASAAASGQPQDMDSLIAHVTGSPDDSSGSAPQSGGLVQGLGEGSGLGGVGTALKAAAQANQEKSQNFLDMYHKMLDAHAAGDVKGAALSAFQLLSTATQLGVEKSYAPFVEAAKMIVLDPIKAVQETRAKMSAAGNGDMAQGASNQAKAIWNKAKQDWQSGSPDRTDQVLTDVTSGVSNAAGVSAIPLAGPAVSQMANHLNEATHAPGGEDRGRIIGNALGAGATFVAGEGVGALGKALPGASGDVAAGLAEGQAGADAAQTAADTAKAHDTILQANKDEFKNQLDTSIQKAQDTKSAATEANKENTVEAGNETAERKAAHKQDVESTRDSQHQAIDDSLEKAKQDYADQFKQSLSTQTTGALPPEDLAPKINEGIDKYEQKSHEDFEDGMNGEGGVIDQLEGHSEPVIGSPLQEKAAQLLKKPTPGDHPLNLGAKNLAGVKLDGSVQKWLQDASEGMMDVEAPGPADEAGNPTTQTVRKPMGDLTAEQLVGIRQNLREAASQFQRGDLNRRVLGDMINATDNTLERLAKSAENKDVLNQYEDLRSQYKTARANLDTSVADKLRLDSPDKAMGDVNKYLLQGNNAPAKIQTIGSMVGEETMQGLRQSYVQQLAEMGPEAAAKALAKIPAATKQAFFGAELDGRLAAAQSLYEKSVSHAEEMAAAQKQAATDTAATALSDRSVQSKYDQQATSAAARKENARIAEEYNKVAKTARDLHDTQAAPYSTKFAQAISDGSIGDKLAADKISTEDINALKTALDPDDLKTIQNGILNRQMADSMTNGHFNSAQFMKWYDSIPEPARNAFFSDAAGAPLTVNVSAFRDAAKLQNLVRAGLVTAGTGAAGALVTVVPHTALAVLLEAAAGAAAVSRKELIANLLDTVAANPKYLTRLAKVVPAAKTAAKAVNTATRAATVAGPVLGPSFGKRVTVNGQTGTVLGDHPDSGKPFVEWDK